MVVAARGRLYKVEFIRRKKRVICAHFLTKSRKKGGLETSRGKEGGSSPKSSRFREVQGVFYRIKVDRDLDEKESFILHYLPQYGSRVVPVM